MSSAATKADDALFVRGFKTKCENLAIQYRTHLGLSETSPLSAWELAEYLEVTILDLDKVPNLPRDSYRHLASTEGDEWSAVAVRSGTKDYIVLNPLHSPARQSNDCMHELAHIILNHAPCKVTVSESTGLHFRTFDKRQEAEADWLASCLLLPRRALEASYRKKLTADSAATYFGVSKHLYTYRLGISGVEKQHAFRRTPGSS